MRKADRQNIEFSVPIITEKWIGYKGIQRKKYIMMWGLRLKRKFTITGASLRM